MILAGKAVLEKISSPDKYGDANTKRKRGLKYSKIVERIKLLNPELCYATTNKESACESSKQGLSHAREFSRSASGLDKRLPSPHFGLVAAQPNTK
eukprot:g16409.t1